jgi:hypothetical protein
MDPLSLIVSSIGGTDAAKKLFTTVRQTLERRTPHHVAAPKREHYVPTRASADQHELERQQAFLRSTPRGFVNRGLMERVGASPPRSPLFMAPPPPRPSPTARRETPLQHDLGRRLQGQPPVPPSTPPKPAPHRPHELGLPAQPPLPSPTARTSTQEPSLTIEQTGLPSMRLDRQGLLHPADGSLPEVYVLDPRQPYTVEPDTDALTRAKTSLLATMLGAGPDDVENPLVRDLGGLPPRDPMRPRVDTTADGHPILMNVIPRLEHPRYEKVASDDRKRAAEENIIGDLNRGTDYAPSREGLASWRSWATLGLGPVAEHCGRSLGLAEGYADNNPRRVYGYGQYDEPAFTAAIESQSLEGGLDAITLATGILPAARTLRAAGEGVQFVGRRTVSAVRGLKHVDPRMYAGDVRAGGIVENGAYRKAETANISRVTSTSGLTQQGRLRVPGSSQAPRGSSLMYVVDENGAVTISKRAGQRLPHPTLVGGRDPRVQAAGMVEFDGKGRILRISNGSGHFKPGSATLARAQKAFSQLPPSAFSPKFEGYVDYAGRVIIAP